MSQSVPAVIADQRVNSWLAELREYFQAKAPELLPLLDIYSEEAKFGRAYISHELSVLSQNANVLEVGAGAMLLSCQLVREGFNVTALEPIASGFSHFDKMRGIVIERARSTGCLPNILTIPAEELGVVNQFDFAYSVNVMEHVTSVSTVIENVGRSLRNGACYKFTCPNYLFPYEPHFNIPILLSKQITAYFLRNKIFKSTAMPDPQGTWDSLNWISVLSIKKIVDTMPGMRVDFGRDLIASTLVRVVTDQEFASRRSKFMRKLLGLLVRCGLHNGIKMLPAVFHPIVDCKIKKMVYPEKLAWHK